jgi:DNA replication protein DnaC
MPVIVPKEKQIKGLVYCSKEWNEVLKWVAPNNEWLHDDHMRWVVENNFPWPWNLMNAKDISLYKQKYISLQQESNKKRLNCISNSKIPYTNAKWKNVSIVFGDKELSDKKNHIVFGNNGGHFNGKTYACSAFVTEIYDLYKIDCLYFGAQELQDLCQNNVHLRDELVEDLAKNIDCLLVDDLGEEKCGYNQNFVLNLIYWRLKNNKQVFLSTALSSIAFKAYSERLYVICF